MNETTTTKDKPKYRFWITVYCWRHDDSPVHCEWDNLTMLAAKQMYKATQNNYAVQAANGYQAPIKRFGWEEMK